MMEMAWRILLMLGLFSFSSALINGSEPNASNYMLSVNDFAIDLYRELTAKKEDGQNLFFSPYSIYTALAMTMVGAGGNTCDEINKALNWDHFVQNDEKNYGHMSFRNFNKVIMNQTEGNQKLLFSLANKLWLQKYFMNRFARKYSSRLRKLYDAELGEVDFSFNSEQARENINKWVAKKTNDKIKDLMQPRSVTPLTRIVLTNAIHFMGTWKTKFDEKETGPMPFYVNDKTIIKVQMMRVVSKFGYTENDNFQVLELPYTGDKMSMVLFLPKPAKSLNKVEDLISAGVMNDMISKLTLTKVSVRIPKLKLESSIDLKENLKKLGIRDMFDAKKADLSLMLGVKGLYISKVVHKAYVDVNEKGTEAAAATAVSAHLFSVFRGKVFMANRPFLFAIRDIQSGVLIFMGRVVSPL